jgi:hypothetical protein
MEEGAGNSYAMIEPMPDAWLIITEDFHNLWNTVTE